MGFGIWVATPYKPSARALEASKSSDSVRVEYRSYIVFHPKTEATKGVIIYPGGRIDPLSYSSLCRRISESGYLCVIVPMMFNIAFTGINKADEVIRDNAYINSWALVGHSLGGIAACRYIAKNPSKLITSLVLLASYSDIDLSHVEQKIILVRGDLDGLLDSNVYEKNKPNLPLSASSILIRGGNHSQMGDYNLQEGDKMASISLIEQEKIVAQSIIQSI